MPECKYCNVELEFDDTIDEDTDESEVAMKEIGHCPKCGKDYVWFDIYKYSHYKGLEEV